MGSCYDCDTSDVNEPLEIKRPDLIKTLQTNLDKAKAEREERNAAVIASMEEFKAFLGEHADEVAGFVAKTLGFRSWAESLKQIERLFEDTDFKPREIKASGHETALEKFVRVLSLASNDTIKITPNEELYSLL